LSKARAGKSEEVPCRFRTVYQRVYWLLDIRELRGESWRARAVQPKASLHARTVGITALGADRVVADETQTHCPCSEGLVP
jgi:hypothetical protein